MSISTQNPKALRSRRGVAAVEAAVCLPILVFIMLTAIEVSGGIFQEYNAQASAYELSKLALRPETSCDDVQLYAQQVMSQLDFDTFSVQIDVVPRTVNASSVEPPSISSFRIPQTGPAPAGLENTPRGTLLKLTLTANRPSIAGIGFATTFLSSEISSDCVFVKEF